MDNIFILKQSIDKKLEKKKGKLYVFYADLKAAFDSLNRIILWKTLEKMGVSKNLRRRIEEVYLETKNVVKDEGKVSDLFWTNLGVRQGCPLSPTLFIAYIADLEQTLKNAQDGGTVVGKQKYWSLAYADDVGMVAETREEMVCMLVTLSKYLKRKKLKLNVEKSKMMVFRKGGGRDKVRTWKWEGQEIEEVKEFTYLGYKFQRNNSPNQHIRMLAAKATRAMKQVWGIGEQLFANSPKTRIMMFEVLVKSILMYGAEIWGWKEREMLEKIQLKYLRWVMGLSRSTPSYIILEEMKCMKLRVESGKRATKFENKIRKRKEGDILKESLKEIERRRKRGENTSWDLERKQYLERTGMSEIVYEERSLENEKEFTIKLANRDEEVQRQVQWNRIQESRFHPKYRFIMANEKPKYLRKGMKKEELKVVARFRCGCEERSNMFWLKEEEKSCRFCKRGRDEVVLWMKDCDMIEKSEKGYTQLMNENGNGVGWMKMICARRNE